MKLKIGNTSKDIANHIYEAGSATGLSVVAMWWRFRIENDYDKWMRTTNIVLRGLRDSE